jgi:hypothetical protein
MSAPYGRSASGDSQYHARLASYLDEFHPGERIGQPPASRRARVIRRSLVLAALTGFGIWAYAYDTAGWLPWLAQQTRTMTAQRATEQPKAADAAPEKLAPIDPAASEEPVQQQAATERPPPAPAGEAATQPPAPAAPLTTGALPSQPEPEEAPADTGPPEPLPPPTVDKSDPFQVKAAAAGLHPGLSRALLSKLTAADYRNAAQAVDTAFADTADSDTYTWPRQRKPEQALFQVHFVPGAAPDCRRYVVTVTKDGWITTALPMERCGVKRAAIKPKAKSG